MEPLTKTQFTSSLRAWYSSSLEDFIQESTDAVIGKLSSNSQFAILPTQRDAWRCQIDTLQKTFSGLAGALFLEFNIPRMGRRIDAVVISGPIVFVIEFKVGEEEYKQAAIDQVWDYALDLKNFHEGSHTVAVVPILVATNAPAPEESKWLSDEDGVYRPIRVNVGGMRKAIDAGIQKITGVALDHRQWAKSSYCPTPTIIEAARSLYAQHSVEAIARHDAGARNLRVTSRRIEELVDEARTLGQKIICFVTGVPGAGKTLVGLNIATHRRDKNALSHAVFLSGNGPLVAVLREALTRDEVDRRKRSQEKISKKKVGESVKAFIQNVHHFRDEGLIDSAPPIDHVVIFDEAQRAWNMEQTKNFMKRKKNKDNFFHSEPEFLISYMDRHKDWAAIICLVGGGQEINTGEAGIGAWIEAVTKSFPQWKMFISPELSDSEYAAGEALDSIRHRRNTHFDDALHLSVSLRSFRADNVSMFVKAVLDGEEKRASEALSKFAAKYPLAITRDLNAAKRWVRDHARGSERCGILASSRAQRLKPHAIDIRVAIDPIHWFLNPKDDTRSSYYLEDAATEFQVQGLELDWACVTWDGDLRHNGAEWSYHDFRGNRWTNVLKSENRNYLRNAYRVLLTRARQGMIIFVPPGEPTDPTRAADYYDPTFEYLAGLGISVLK